MCDAEHLNEHPAVCEIHVHVMGRSLPPVPRPCQKKKKMLSELSVPVNMTFFLGGGVYRVFADIINLRGSH